MFVELLQVLRFRSAMERDIRAVASTRVAAPHGRRELMGPNDGKPAKRASRGTKVEHLQLPPHSIEAEQSVLGGLMLNDLKAWAKISGLIDRDSFYRKDHRLIFGAIADLQTRGSAVDSTTVADYLDQRSELGDAGGLSYIGTIARDTPTTANIVAYAEIVRDRSARRAIQSIAAETIDSATSTSAVEIAANMQSKLRGLQLDVGESMRKPIDWPKLAGEPPPRRDFIRDWLGPHPTLHAGAGGKGKTTITQAILTALAVNRPYLEEASGIADLRVLIWNCEDDESEIWRKQIAINAHFGVAMSDLEDRLYIVARLGLENTMFQLSMGTPQFTPMFFQLREQVNDLGIDVLAVDNINQVYGGLNDPHQVTQFVNAFAGLVRNRPFAPILLGHIARSEGSEFAGSAAWENAVRMRWYLGSKLPDQEIDKDQETDPDVVYLARRKANYTNKDFRRLRFKNGLFVPDPPEGGVQLTLAMRSESAEAVVLNAFSKLIAAGMQPSDKAQSGDYLPKQIIALGHHQEHTKKELVNAMNRLMGSGRLKRVEIGKYSNRNPKYGLAVV